MLSASVAFDEIATVELSASSVDSLGRNPHAKAHRGPRWPLAPLQRYMPSTIDVDGFAGHVGRFGQQKMHGLGDVLGSAFTLERRVRNDALSRELVEALVVRPEDWPRRNRVDAHFRRELPRERACEPDQPRFCNAVDDVILKRPLGVNGGEFDYV